MVKMEIGRVLKPPGFRRFRVVLIPSDNQQQNTIRTTVTSFAAAYGFAFFCSRAAKHAG